MIKIESLRFRYSSNEPLLDNINIAINPGEIIAFVGNNGSGKTTLLKIIAGLIDNYQGQIVKKCKRLIYVPSNLNDFLLPWYSVRKNFAFYQNCGRSIVLRDEDAVDDILRLILPVFNKTFYKKKIYELSSGQKAVVGLVCSILYNPDVFLFDEVFANLSAEVNMKIFEHLKKDTYKTKTIVFTSHSNNVVKELSTKQLTLENKWI